MYLFSLLITLVVALAFLTKSLLISDTLYFNSLVEQLSYEHIQDVVYRSKEWDWLSYLLIPLLYTIKCSLIALCLGIGLFFITDRFEFKKLFGVAVAAEFVFLIPAVRQAAVVPLRPNGLHLRRFATLLPALSPKHLRLPRRATVVALPAASPQRVRAYLLGGAGLRRGAGHAATRRQPRHRGGGFQLRHGAGDLGGGGHVSNLDIRSCVRRKGGKD